MKYLIWDFDGTLAYRDGMWSGTLAQIVKSEFPDTTITKESFKPYLKSGFPWHEPERMNPPGRSSQEWWDTLDPLFESAFCLGANLPNRQAKAFAKKVRYVYPDIRYWFLYADTLSTLRALSEEGWTHLLLSNHVPELAQLVHSLGLAGFFLKMWNSAVTGIEKPHKKAFEKVVQELNTSKEIFMIGDNIKADIKGAERVGIQGILVRKSHPEATFQCENVSEIQKILKTAKNVK